MRVPSWALDVPVFLCHDAVDRNGNTYHRPFASGFLAFVRRETNQQHLRSYVVTARHAIEEPAMETIYIRVSRKMWNDSGFEDVPTRRSDWRTHESADVAAISFHAPHPSMIVNPVGVNDMVVDSDGAFRGRALPDEIKKIIGEMGGIKIGVGDQLFFTGLFIQHPGRNQLLPIARFGAIAQLPAEPIRIEVGRGSDRYQFEIAAYLAECHSWGGHSGSPVFWVYPFIQTRSVPKMGIVSITQRWICGLLGLVSSHFDIEAAAQRTGEFSNLEGDIRTGINSGIAVITPAAAITELLMREDFVRDRAIEPTGVEDVPISTADSALGQIEAGGFTGEEFEKALRRVSRRIKPSEPGQASSET